LGYEVILMGQSMGATASMIAAGEPDLKDKIPAILLWVPDPETDTEVKDPEEIHNEGGQQVKMKFWIEAHSMKFYDSLREFNHAIHLVYGEFDKYVSRELMDETIKIVEDKKQTVMILPGQDHSPWEFDVAQDVYEKEIEFLNKNT
jgi:pimeloyl-ACP methyl ester carboxylesterase